LAVTSVVHGATQPDVLSNSVSRQGRQAHVRVVNRLSTTGFSTTNFNVNGGAVTGMSDSVDIRVKHGSTLQTGPGSTISTTPGTSFTTITKIDASGTSANLEAHFAFTGQTLVVQCSGSVPQAGRSTVLISQTVAQPSFNAGTCSTMGGTCPAVGTLASKGNVQVSCNIVNTDVLSTGGRSCGTVPVRFFNDRTSGCDELIEDAAVSTGTAKALLSSPINPGRGAFGTFTITPDRTANLKLENVPLFASPSVDRFVDIHVPVSGSVVSQAFQSGFINVANVAHRLVSGNLANTFKVVILSDSATVARENVVHVIQSLAPGAAAGWIEVPVDASYHIAVFDTTVTDSQLFGDTTTNPAVVASPPTPLITGSLTVVAGTFFVGNQLRTNEMAIFRINGDINGASLSVNNVPLNGESITQGATKAIIWNNIIDVGVKFAQPQDDCCNYAFSTRTAAFAFNTGVKSAEISSSQSFKVFPGTASDQCISLGAQLTSPTIDFSVPGGSVCEVEGVILHGRNQAFTETVSTGCTTPATTVANKNKIVSLTTAVPAALAVPADTGDITLTFEATMCSCVVPATPCAASLDCAEEAAFAALTAAVAASTTTITSAVSSSTTSIQTTVQAVNNTFITNIDDNNAGIDIALAAIASTNNTLHVQLGKVQTTQAEHTTTLSSLQRKVLREINGVEDDIEDVADDIDDIAKAVDA